MPDFVHLHTHTEFSLLDGLSSPKALANYATQLGMSALAITDHGAMYGVVDFYKACKGAGIKPIIGIEAYMAHGARQSRDRTDGKPYHVVLLAQNQAGYQNLLALASLAQLEGFYYKPRIDKELLAAHSEGVIVLSACLQGEIPRLLLQRQEAQAREAVRWYQQHFPDRFYLEIQDHDIPEQRQANPLVIALAREMNVPLVATNDIHYARRDQFEAHDVLLCVGTGKTVNEPNRMRMSDNSYYMRSPDEMAALFKDTPDALENTVKIAEQCNVEIQFAPPYHVPRFPVPESCGDSQTYLRHLCDEGMITRYGADAARPDYVERLEYELGVIHEMGFDDYFLIVWDLCKAAERMDIWWNVRGSGAGSVVAYTLNITNVDPFKNRLFFERFLNPGRISMPDIDLDYPDDRREELIAYCAERYGKDKVSGIITFGTLGARAAIRDVGRAMDIPLGEVDRVARLVPNVPGKPVSIQEALETIPELKEIYQSTPYIKTLLDTATQLEGVARHASTHAAGVLVSDLPLTAYLPLNRPTKGEGAESALDRVSQWAMEVVDALGMLKVDFLGLRTLTHMRKTCEWIEREHGRKFDLNTIPYERAPDNPPLDAEVKALYDLLASGETTGVFQVESAGMRRVLRDMRPYQFQHIVAAIALYRPGPMDNIPTYIKRLHGEEEVKYHHPLLEQALGDTYGICITGDALVINTRTGQRLRLDEISAHEAVEVQGIDTEWRPATGKVTHWVHNGRKPVFELRLRNGATIKATAEHRFLTENGWLPLSDLSVDTYIATPPRLLPHTQTYDRDKLRILAYLLADGDLGNLAAVNFVSKDAALLEAYEKALGAFPNLSHRRIQQVREVTRITVAKSKPDDYHAPNALLAWLRELGLKHPPGQRPGGARSTEKFVPEFVFSLKEDDVVFFLAALWDCDGYAGKKFWHYRTISKQLAYDVQTLLLLCGIPACIYTADYENSRGARTAYQVTVYDAAHLHALLQPYLLTSKKEVESTGSARNSVERTAFITELESATTLSKRALMETYQVDRQHFYPKGRTRARITTSVIAPLLEQLPLPETARRAQLNWEPIISITPTGEEDVYDITVDGLHNFVANNIIVHNCVYQEQIMQIAVEMAGYEPGEADGIRKAVAKKKRDLMDKHHQMFRAGCIARNIPGEVADAVWGDIEFFARYGFNRAHATDYAVITAQTAYLKAHYPLEFMTALMTTERNNIEKLGLLISDARRTGMQVLPPCVNASDVDFTIERTPEGRAIRIGLGAIKNVGAEAVRVIVTAREKDGLFGSLDALANRVDLRKLNRRTLECLIQAGALDAFGPRSALLAIMDGLLSASSQIHTAREQGQLSLFGSFASSAPTLQLPAFAPPIAQRKLLEWEKELLGTYISEHPLARQEQELLQAGLISMTLDQVEAESMPGQQLILVGSIQRVRRIQTKKGATMAFLTLEGSSATLDAVIFPKTYDTYHEIFAPGRVVVVSGKLDQRPDREDHPVLADWIKEPHELLWPVDEPPLAQDYAPIASPPVSREPRSTYGQLGGNGGTQPVAAPPAPPPPTPAAQPLAPPEEPPEAATLLYITIHRTGDNERDFSQVSQVHTLLTQERGRDQFVVILQGNSKPISLSFPNNKTRYTPALRASVESLVGNGNVKVVAAPAG